MKYRGCFRTCDLSVRLSARVPQIVWSLLFVLAVIVAATRKAIDEFRGITFFLTKLEVKFSSLFLCLKSVIFITLCNKAHQWKFILTL